MLKGNLCIDWNPLDPGDTFVNLIHYCSDKTKAFVLLIDEIDILIGRSKNVINNNYNPIELINNKASWNKILDKIDKGLYKNLIIIITSNLLLNELNEIIDDSLFRSNRINIALEFN